MAVHVHVLARRWLLLAFAAVCRAASRGIVAEVRTLLHYHHTLLHYHHYCD